MGIVPEIGSSVAVKVVPYPKLSQDVVTAGLEALRLKSPSVFARLEAHEAGRDVLSEEAYSDFFHKAISALEGEGLVETPLERSVLQYDIRLQIRKILTLNLDDRSSS